MTFLNSGRKVSWDLIWVEQSKVQEIPPHCSEISNLFGRYSYPHFLHFHIEKMAEGWQAEVYLVSGARQVGTRNTFTLHLPLPYLNQAVLNNRIGENRIE